MSDFLRKSLVATKGRRRDEAFPMAARLRAFAEREDGEAKEAGAVVVVGGCGVGKILDADSVARVHKRGVGGERPTCVAGFERGGKRTESPRGERR